MVKIFALYYSVVMSEALASLLYVFRWPSRSFVVCFSLGRATCSKSARRKVFLNTRINV